MKNMTGTLASFLPPARLVFVFLGDTEIPALICWFPIQVNSNSNTPPKNKKNKNRVSLVISILIQQQSRISRFSLHLIHFTKGLSFGRTPCQHDFWAAHQVPADFGNGLYGFNRKAPSDKVNTLQCDMKKACGFPSDQ